MDTNSTDNTKEPLFKSMGRSEKTLKESQQFSIHYQAIEWLLDNDTEAKYLHALIHVFKDTKGNTEALKGKTDKCWIRRGTAFFTKYLKRNEQTIKRTRNSLKAKGYIDFKQVICASGKADYEYSYCIQWDRLIADLQQKGWGLPEIRLHNTDVFTWEQLTETFPICTLKDMVNGIGISGEFMLIDVDSYQGREG